MHVRVGFGRLGPTVHQGRGPIIWNGDTILHLKPGEEPRLVRAPRSVIARCLQLWAALEPTYVPSQPSPCSCCKHKYTQIRVHLPWCAKSLRMGSKDLLACKPAPSIQSSDCGGSEAGGQRYRPGTHPNIIPWLPENLSFFVSVLSTHDPESL